MKHIESIQPEYAAGDLSRLLVSEPDATASAALSRLLHNVTGCAIPPTADLPESEVEELVPLCLSILRRHWTTPLTALGDGTTPMSLADLMRRLIGDRVQGNEALGIPPANANIPTAVAALLDRKIDVAGSSQFLDGVSMPMAMISADVADNVYSLIDTSTKPWTAFDKIRYYNLKKLVLNCDIIDYRYGIPNGQSTSYIPTSVEELELSELVNINNIISFESNNTVCSILLYKSQVRELRLPKFSSFTSPVYYCSIATYCNELKILDLPSLVVIYEWGRMKTRIANGCPNLRYLRIKGISGGVFFYNVIVDTPSLIHLEIIDELNSSVDTCQSNGNGWNPTMALRTDTNAEDYVDLREDTRFANNLEQFLSNFKTYIAQRLTDKGSGLTLTLSQAVRDAIQKDPDIVNIITSKGWTISPAPSV